MDRATPMGTPKSKRGGNLWSEKEGRRENRNPNSYIWASCSSSSSKSKRNIVAGELLGMALTPCGRQHLSGISSNHTCSRNCYGGDNSGSGGERRPFASHPLLYRGDSLVEQVSLFSLVASNTMETVDSPTNGEIVQPPKKKSGSSPSTTVATGESNNSATPSPSFKISFGATPIRNCQPGKHCTPPHGLCFNTMASRSLSSPPMPPDSPAVELSRAKQAANMAQMTFVRTHYREMLRSYCGAMPYLLSPGGKGYRVDRPSPSKSYREMHMPIKSPCNGSIVTSSPGCTRQTPPSKTKLTQKEGESDSLLSLTPAAKKTNKDSINTRRVMNPYLCFENAKPPPPWSNEAGINSELVSTYQYPRLYLKDPAKIEYREIWTGNGGKNELWWFHLAQRMETTLKHVQDDGWKLVLSGKKMQNQGGIVEYNRGSDSISVTSSLAQHHPSGCSGRKSDTISDGCVSMRVLCLGEQQQQQQQQQMSNHGMEIATRESRRSSKWSSSHSPKPKRKKGTAALLSSPAFQPSATPVNTWSEPSAKTVKVRGPSYSRDGIKVESDSSIFAVLGVDNFVNHFDAINPRQRSAGGNEDYFLESCSWGTKSYLQRWNHACEEMGLDYPPFSLIINFIVPWGNFQAYFIRPNGDNGGPFSSRHKHHPSEKAWRTFMEGTTDYRNERFKLIPRICAGPWMVKKMVGSTPVLVGTKLPVTYCGSVEDNYLEVTLDVTKGPAFANSIANTVMGKADIVTVDLGFVIEGQEEEGHLPEQMLGLIRLHHLNMKVAPTHSQWKYKVS